MIPNVRRLLNDIKWQIDTTSTEAAVSSASLVFGPNHMIHLPGADR
jgi:hypothetical protein